MTDLLRQLHGYGEQLEARMPVLEVEDVRFARVGSGPVRPVVQRETARRRWWPVAAAAGAAALVGIVVAVLLWAGRGDPAPFVDDGSTLPSTTLSVPTTTMPSLAPVGACPPGSNPDEPGQASQARPFEVLLMAFDRDSARIVAVGGRRDAETAPETWAFDVCTNTWQRMAPLGPAPNMKSGIAYDADSDLVVAVAGDGNPLVYDLEANTWTVKGPSPVGGRLRLAYDSASDLVFVQQTVSGDSPAPPQRLFTFDIEADAWNEVHQTGDLPPGTSGDHLLMAYDDSVDRIVAVGAHGNSGSTWVLDPRTSTWTGAAAHPLFNTGYFGCPGAIAYDEARQRTVVFSDGLVAAYDAAADRWETLAVGQESPDGVGYGPQNRLDHWMVYDPVNERLVVAGGEYRTADGWVRADDVWAFDPATGEWIELLSPSRVEPG